MRRGSTASYYQQDALGSVGSLTSPAGSVSQRYQYGSFGEPVASTDSSGNPFSYTGRELDAMSANYFYRARDYDSRGGIFTGEDPQKGTNEYTYVANSPANLVDPTGEYWLQDQLEAIATNDTLIALSTRSGLIGGLARTVIRAAQSRALNVVVRTDHALNSSSPGHEDLGLLTAEDLAVIEGRIVQQVHAIAPTLSNQQLQRGSIEFGGRVIEFNAFRVDSSLINVGSFWFQQGP